MIMATMQQQYCMDYTRKYCVYAHSSQGEVFYIGQGRIGRPFDTCNRSAQWHYYVQQRGAYFVSILGYFDTQHEALQEEARLLFAVRPLCNLNHAKTSVIRDNIPPTSNRPPLRSSSPDAQLICATQALVTLQHRCNALERTLKEVRKHRCVMPSFWQLLKALGCRLLGKRICLVNSRDKAHAGCA